MKGNSLAVSHCDGCDSEADVCLECKVCLRCASDGHDEGCPNQDFDYEPEGRVP